MDFHATGIKLQPVERLCIKEGLKQVKIMFVKIRIMAKISDRLPAVKNIKYCLKIQCNNIEGIPKNKKNVPVIL